MPTDQALTIQPVPSARIRSVTQPAPNGVVPSTLASYWRLQSGSIQTWFSIWMLQNLRYLPVYIIPLLTGWLIDRIDVTDSSKALGPLPWALAACVVMCVGNVIGTTSARVLLSRINRTLTAGLRRSLLRRINRLTFAFHDQAQQGALQNKFTLDMGRLEGFQNFLAESILMYGTATVVTLVIVAWTNPLLLIVIASTVPLNLLVARALWARIKKSNEQFRQAESAFMANLNETLSGLRISRAHATEAFSEERLSKSAGSVAKEGMRLDMVNTLFNSSSWAVSSILTAIVLGLGIWLAVSPTHQFHFGSSTFAIERITIGELTILMSYYGIIAGAVGNILSGLPNVAAAGDAIRSLAHLYQEEDEEPNRGKRVLDRVHGDIRFQAVSFTYPEAQRHSVDKLDLHIPAGTSLALVGPSGSGKSTIASLVLGFYQPTSGAVLIDGQDLKELDLRSVRRFVGVVSQDVVLFQDTIQGNITWGDPQPDALRAYSAAQRANALDFINAYPDGMLHMLGDRGIGLSGGQRQRLAIARALYRNPQFLILDEATSALDPESERLVQQALDELMKGRSTLIIAHRLSTVRGADNIAVIKHGQLAETGCFLDLMNRKGEFYRLANGQFT